MGGKIARGVAARGLRNGGARRRARACRGSLVAARCSEESGATPELGDAMRAARANEAAGVSPGAGLASAEEQAEAAFADLVNTSAGVSGELTDEDVAALQAGGEMDAESKERKGSGGLLGDAIGMFKALSGGAHIVRQDDGRL